MRKVFSRLALCITAILVIALCGCDDLGAYEDVREYYDSVGDVVLINGSTGQSIARSVDEYFYNEESRENFLVGEDGKYGGVTHGAYYYMAIPFESDIDMDSLGLYLQSNSDVTLYIDVYLTDEVPSEKEDDEAGEAGAKNESMFTAPEQKEKIGSTTLYLETGKWSSFLLESFSVEGAVQQSILIDDGKYIVLQFRNNSDLMFGADKQEGVSQENGIELKSADITMTNLLVRALTVEDEEMQEEES